MNKSYRIKTNIGSNTNKHIKLKLEQEVDHFEILSLKIDQKDVYQKFNCNHGVLVGRVNGNNAVGIPNAKISIFIPITDEDKLRPEIVALYPYENPRDENFNGKRYNLLPRVATERSDGQIKPKQPFGSFPTKQEIVTNSTTLEVYEKYYKYSTVTNEVGDYMLFGVPTGVQTVHMSVDITDIGRFSMTPATMVTNLGFPENLFIDNTTKIKDSNDLDDLPNIETQEIAVNIIPFCGDDELFDIGITRQDFRIRAQIVSTFTLFGTSFTDGIDHMWADGSEDSGVRRIRELYRSRNEYGTPSIGTKTTYEIKEKIYVINSNISDADADAGNFDTTNDVRLLSPTEYTKFIRGGDFVYVIPCNRNKIIINELGQETPVSNDFNGGIFTTFRGFIIFEYEESTIPSIVEDLGNNLRARAIRMRYKFPQSANRGNSFISTEDSRIENWRKQHFNFEFNKIYSVAQFYGTVGNDTSDDSSQTTTNDFGTQDHLNDVTSTSIRYNVGAILTSDFDGNINDIYEFPNNHGNPPSIAGQFLGNWMNFAIHFNQIGYATSSNGLDFGWRVTSSLTPEYNNDRTHFLYDNAQEIAGGDVNTKWLGRSDLHYTDFIEVPLTDVINLNNVNLKGFTETQLNGLGITLQGDYKNGEDPCPENGGKLDANPANGTDTEIYFYRGLIGSDCISLLKELSII